jgi:hypothetical protein
MVSRVAAGLGVVLALLAAGLLVFGSASDHSYTVEIHKSGNAYVVTKNTTFFEVDYQRTTTWSIANQTDDSIDFQFDEWIPSSGFCVVDFSPAGDHTCQSKRITLAPRGSTTVTATARDLMPDFWYYVYPFNHFNSDFLAGATTTTVLPPLDPEIEIDRDGLLAIISLLLALMFGGLWFFMRRRALS